MSTSSSEKSTQDVATEGFSNTGSHRTEIEALARETGAQLEQVQMLFEREYSCLEATARVRGFLSVIALRNVMRELRDPHREGV